MIRNSHSSDKSRLVDPCADLQKVVDPRNLVQIKYLCCKKIVIPYPTPLLKIISFVIIPAPLHDWRKIWESWATPNWSKGSVGQEESRSKILSPRSSIPNTGFQVTDPKPQILNPKFWILNPSSQIPSPNWRLIQSMFSIDCIAICN